VTTITSSADPAEAATSQRPTKMARKNDSALTSSVESFAATGVDGSEPTGRRQRSKRSLGVAPKTASLTIEDVMPLFPIPIREAARRLGICTTLLKQLCRRLGIHRWPQRKVPT